MLPIIYSSIVLVPNTAPELALGVSSQRTFYSTVLSLMFHRCLVASSDSVSLLGLRLSTKLMSLWCRCVQCSIFFLFLKQWNWGWVSAQCVVLCPRSCVKSKLCGFLGKRKPPNLWFVVMSLRWSEQVRKIKVFVSCCFFFSSILVERHLERERKSECTRER